MQFCKSSGEPVVIITDNGNVDINGNVKIKGNLTVDGMITGQVRQPIGCDRYFSPAISWSTSCDNRGPVEFFEKKDDGSIIGRYRIGSLIK